MQKNEIFLEKFDNINPRKILTWTLIFIGGVIMVTPIIFMISTSLKTGQEVYFFSLIPDKITFKNYIFVITESKFGYWMLNSLWVATFSTLSVLFFRQPCRIHTCKIRIQRKRNCFYCYSKYINDSNRNAYNTMVYDVS